MKLALVVGCAECVWDDVRAAQELAEFDAIYCVKLAGAFWPNRFDVWVTLHPEYMDVYEQKRRTLGYPDGYEIVAPLEIEVGSHAKEGNIARRVSYRWPRMNASGSSGIYGAKVALDDGYLVVLAGVPMDTTNHFSRKQPWAASQLHSFMDGFKQSIPFMRGRVKSMSGLTREKLGEPTPEWLAGQEG